MPNRIHIHMAKAYQADHSRNARAHRHASQAIGKPPNARPAKTAGAAAIARIAARIDREAARKAIA